MSWPPGRSPCTRIRYRTFSGCKACLPSRGPTGWSTPLAASGHLGSGPSRRGRGNWGPFHPGGCLRASYRRARQLLLPCAEIVNGCHRRWWATVNEWSASHVGRPSGTCATRQVRRLSINIATDSVPGDRDHQLFREAPVVAVEGGGQVVPVDEAHEGNDQARGEAFPVGLSGRKPTVP